MSLSEMPGSSKKSRARKKSGKSSPRSADSMTASSSSLNETPEKLEKLDSVESTAQLLQTETENLNGDEHTNGPRKTKKKKSKKSKRRRDSKDTFLIGFSGAFPKALSTHSMESNSDAEHQSPAELKALSSTGLRVFPREEEEHLQPSLPTTDNNNSISTESLNVTNESQPPHTILADQDLSKTFLSSNRILRKRSAAACSIGSSDEMEKLKKTFKGSEYRSKSISAPFDQKLQPRPLRTRSMCVLLNLEQEPEKLATDAIKPAQSNTRRRLYSSGMPKISPTDELYRKPFEYGWKRELVLRNVRKGAAPRGDVFFIAPSGKKLRSRDDIIPLLKGDLSIENFCFQREALGAGPEFETVRVAVPNSNRRRSNAPLQREDASSSTPPLVVSGKRVSKPKAPKGASPPPVGWTPTMAVKGNARVLAASNGNSSGGSSSIRKRGTLMKASASAAAAIAQRTSGAPKLSQPSASTSVAAKNSNVSAQALTCLRCQAKIEGHNAYKFATSDKESTCHICVRCLKSSNEPSRTKEAPEVQPVLSATNETINTNNADVNTNEAVHNSDDAEEEQDYGGSLEKAEEIELPGQLPPAQLLSKNAASAAKRLSRIQDITVIGGRKYLTVAEDPVLPRTQVEHRKPRAEALKKYSFKRSWHKETRKNFAELMNDASTGCQVLKAIMKTLPIGVLCKMAQVCNLWHLVSQDTGVWHSVSLKNTHITNWVLFLRYLARQNTCNLDMTGVTMTSPSLRMTGDLRVLKSLRTLRTDPCTAEFVQSVIRMVPHLHELRTTITSPELSLANCHKMHDLRVLHIEMQDKQGKMTPFTPLAALTQLTELSVRGIVQIEGMDVKSLQNLENLQSLVLGSCIGMDTTEFGEQVLPKLVRLKRLRLENRQALQTSFNIGPIMLGASLANSVERLELINVDLDGSFSSQLAACKSIRRLLLVPSYVSNAAKTTNSIMQAISDCKDSLSTFKLGVTQELLRMTAALCSSNEDQTCIPVVRPVPGLMLDDSLNDINDSTNNTPHEWAFLPVDRLESILQNMMPQATLTVAKIPQSQTTFLQF